MANTLGVEDYVVMAVFLSISMGIGIYFACCGGQSKKHYFVGNMKLSILSVTVSIFVTLQSAISLLGGPADVYTYGTMYLYMYIAMLFGFVFSAYSSVPLFYNLPSASVYEYLGLRFGSNAVRLLGTCIGMVQTTVYMGIALFSPALALQAVAGLPLWWSIVIVGVVGTIYTSIGGIKSVVWTDVFQSIIMLVGVVAAIIIGSVKSGGLVNAMKIAEKGGRVQFDVIDPDPRVRHTVWGLVVGTFVSRMCTIYSQSVTLRICAVRNLRGAKIAMLLNAPMVFVYGVLLTVTGLVLYSYTYTTGCDPYEAGYISNRNQLMPYFILQVLGSMPGLTGLYMSMLFSGSLSTLSSGINALAANTVEDLLGPLLRRKRVPERIVTIIAKIAVCFYGAVAIGIAYVARSIPGPVTQISMSALGAGGGPLLGMFLLGGLFPWTNNRGALCGGVIAVVLNIWLSVGAQINGKRSPTLPPAPTYACVDYNVSDSMVTKYTSNSWINQTSTILPPSENGGFSMYDISYLWYATTGVITSLVVGSVVSLITGRHESKKLDPSLLFPFVRRFCNLQGPLSRDNTFTSQAEYEVMTKNRLSRDAFKMTASEDGDGQKHMFT